MTLAGEVANALDGSKIDHLGSVGTFIGPIDKPDQDHASITVFEVTTVPTEFGSNLYNEKIEEVQLKILYAYKPKFDVDAFEDLIASFFMQNNWQRLPNNGHYPDQIQTMPVMAIDMFFRRRK